MNSSLSENEANRLEALYKYNILDTVSEDNFDAITKLASAICETPISAISFIDEKRQWFKSVEGFNLTEIERDISFCAYTVLQDEILIVNNTLNDPRFYNNKLVLNDPKVRFYAGVPLKTSTGQNIGSLCVIDLVPRQLSQKQIDLLYTLSHQVISLLELKLSVNKLEDKQAALNVLIENTDTSMWCIDKDNKLTSFNSTFKNSFEYNFGFPPKVGDLVNPELDKSGYWDSLYNRAFKGEKFTVESEVPVKAGKIYLEISLNPVISNNEVISVASFTKDITDRKLKDLQIIESENKFKTIFDFSPIGMALLNTECKWIKLNNAFCNILGYSEEELLSLTFVDVTHRDDLLEDFIYIDNIFEEKTPSCQREKRYIHKNGEVVWTLINLSLIKDSSDKPLYLLLQAQDITHKKISQLKLSESENRFRSAFDDSSVGMALISTDGQWLKLNKAICKIFGYSEEELYKKSLEELTHPDDLKTSIKYYNKLLTNNLNSYQIEKRYYNKDGKIIWLSLNFSAVFNEFGEQLYFILQTHDVTQRKEWEKKLLFKSNILRNVQDSIIITDINGNITYWNHGARNVFGYSEDEVLGQKIQILYPEDDNTKAEESLKDVALGHSIEKDWKAKTKDGKEIWLDIKTNPLKDKYGNVSGFIGVSRNITEKKEVERELIKAKETAEEALRIKSDFLDTMSHEIRTPMNGIIGMTELLSKTNLTTEQTEFLDIIRKSNSSLMTIISDILDFSKVENHKMELEKHNFDVRNCIEETFSVVSQSAKEKNISLVYYVASDIPKNLLGDPRRIKQLLSNIVNNGIKFSERGELYVSVEQLQKDDKIIKLKFMIKDNGIGMTKETISKLFQAFSQADSSTSRRYGGTGLGLAISKKIIELMNGEIWVESKSGSGSEFYFVIDLEYSEDKKDDITPRSVNLKLSNKKVLLVGNNSPELKVITSYMNQWGISITTVLSLDDVLNIMKDKVRFDAVVTDADVSSFSKLNEIRKIYSKEALPIILITSSDDEQSLKSEFKDLSLVYINKPLKEVNIFNTLNDLFKKEKVEPKNTDLGVEFASHYPFEILLAEDNIINQKLANKILEKMGYKIDIANNGIEAVESLKKKPYDIIFMDIQMPEMGGIEATQYIINNFDELERPKIIALTANAMQGDREVCIEAGMVDYLTKPISIKVLQETLIKWFDK